MEPDILDRVIQSQGRRSEEDKVASKSPARKLLRVAALADDTTGALELGALLAQEKVDLTVTLDADQGPGRQQDHDAIVIDLKTRHVPAREAYEVTRGIALRLARYGVRSFYKKTDSALRGNIAAELQALSDAFPGRPVVYVPAYPQMGRTVKNGTLYVHDVPVAQSEFAFDPRFPVHESSILKLLERQGLRSRAIASAAELTEALREKNGDGILVCDAQTDAELRQLADAIRGVRPQPLAAGPAIFASHWIRTLTIRETEPPTPRVGQRTLIVCGSMHTVSSGQIDLARRRGIGVFNTSEVDAVRAQLEQTSIAAIMTPRQLVGAPDRVVRTVALSASRLVQDGVVDNLVIFGGDTAYSVLQALGALDLKPLSELLPGIALSASLHTQNAFSVVTKAGGFGQQDLVPQLLAKLQDLQ